MVDEEELEELEEQVRELKEEQERREKAAELRKRKRKLEMQDTWYGQILLGLKIYAEKTPKALGKILDWLIPPMEEGEKPSLRHPDPDKRRKKPPEPDVQDPEKREDARSSMEEELYRAMGGTLQEED